MSAALLERLERESGRLRRVGDSLRVPLRFFTEPEARVVAAAGERIFPSDASGPGAKEASVVLYIDRQLAGPYGRDARRYTKGPWQSNSIPEHGYQGRETPQQVYRAGIRELGNFASLSAEQQDARLAQIENTHFFQLLRTHTIEGMFCDPVHGGNAGLVGWKLVGFPGPRMSYYADIDRHNGQAFRPAPAGLQQITGEKITPWEDVE
jgi:gluconate 2-dehydrogenase gamma chain